MKSTRLAGHGLPREGRIYDDRGWPLAVGSARCECGAESPAVTSDNARRRWHREHKAEVAP